MEKFLGDLNCEPSVIYTHQDFVSLKDNHCIHCLFEFLFKFLWAVSFFPRPQSIYKLDMAPTHFNLIMFSVEKAMAPHSSTLAWKIPWTEEPGGLQSMGSRRVRHDWATSLSLFTFMHWRRTWHPTPVFLPGESQGRGSLVGCRLWGRRESDTTEASQQQQQQLSKRFATTTILSSLEIGWLCRAYVNSLRY